MDDDRPDEFVVLLPDNDPAPAWAQELLNRFNRMETRIMADQDKLDTDVKALLAGLGNVEVEIAALKAQPAATSLNFTGLDAAVARLQADAPAPTLPPAPAPAAAPTAPAASAEPTPPAAPSRPLYTHVGNDPVDSLTWPKATETGPNGEALYTFSGDTPGAGHTGASAEWVAYTPPTPA